MLGELLEFVARIWNADFEARNQSIVGESEFEKRSRLQIALICGGVIALLALFGGAW